MPDDAKKAWDTYCARERAWVEPYLSEHGYVLEDVQPHISGERYLMQAVTTASGRKVILLARNTDGSRVLVKASTDAGGIGELNHEHSCEQLLQKLPFAYTAFKSPVELHFHSGTQRAISIHEYIEQEKPFMDRPTPEQFSYALHSFAAQENAHATTRSHVARISHTFGRITASVYLSRFDTFVAYVSARFPELATSLRKANTLLHEHCTTIDQYSDFLTHTDFVPHNFRIRDGQVYLLDLSSLRFGNKYEGWARFTNFMELYNPELAQALMQYVSDNRSPEELQSFKLMRIYRLGEILWYYAHTLEQATGTMAELNKERILFWGAVLPSVLADETVPEEVVRAYREKRDILRTDEEKQRQIGLH